MGKAGVGERSPSCSLRHCSIGRFPESVAFSESKLGLLSGMSTLLIPGSGIMELPSLNQQSFGASASFP